MNLYDTDTSHTFMVGDSEHDITAGKQAGVATIVFYPPDNEAFYSLQKIRALQADHISIIF